MLITTIIQTTKPDYFFEELSNYIGVVFAQSIQNSIDSEPILTYYNSTLCKSILPTTDSRYNTLSD
jgi:hypothetical protein